MAKNRIPIEPTADRVIIEQDPAPENKKGKILLPDEARKQPNYGVVLAVGPGKKRDDGTRVPMTVAVGDHVAYAPYAVTDIEVEGKTYKMCDESGVLATFAK